MRCCFLTFIFSVCAAVHGQNFNPRLSDITPNPIAPGEIDLIETCPALLGQSADPKACKLPVELEFIDQKGAACPELSAFLNQRGYPDGEYIIKDVHEISSENLPFLNDDMEPNSLLESLRINLDYWNRKPDSLKVTVGKEVYPAIILKNTTQKLIEVFSSGLSNEEINSALKKHFRIYRATADDGTEKVTTTGYYEAEIRVSREKTGTYIFPLHSRPGDLIKTTPEMGVDFDYGRIDENGKIVRHYSREEISGGKLDGLNLEIAWAEHPSHIMLVQIQGSGILRFKDSGFVKIGFDGANGWPFKSVQKILMECGEIPAMSFKDFMAYLSSRLIDREIRLVNLNPRYVFFKTKPPDSKPYGAMGYPLVDGRSVAVDPKPVPLGLAGIIKSSRPVADENGQITGFRDFTRLVSAHDTGSAIRGPGRVDIFWGTGKKAEVEASSMKAQGELYIFIIK